MLVPAIIYKDDIEEEFKSKYYSEDMFLETGSLDNWCPNIVECPESNINQFAIVDDEYIIGYFSYTIDWYTDKAYNFGLMSFDKGNKLIGVDVLTEMDRLVKRHHRVEWRMIGGNPVERHYDKFIKRHNGNKYVFKDALKDRDGNYRDDVMYEIVKGKSNE